MTTNDPPELSLRPGQWRRQRGARRVHLYRIGTVPVPGSPLCGSRINYARTERAGDLAYKSPDACYECLVRGVSELAAARSKDQERSS